MLHSVKLFVLKLGKTTPKVLCARLICTIIVERVKIVVLTAIHFRAEFILYCPKKWICLFNA
uniref:Uncharacterized protein n=1 Tax=Solanum lycopersicum TaxID=4081 RepID=A0A3Q7IXG8_SOLLC